MNSSKADRVPEYDVLRFVAAFSVVAYHLMRQPDSYPEIVRYGFMGVPLFFMISGFVILWTATNKTLYGFFASRVSRLYPSYWVCMLLTTALLVLTGSDVPLIQVLANLTMIAPTLGQPYIDEVYWTLFIELEFYALIAGLMFCKQLGHIERWLPVWLACCAVALFVSSWVLNHLVLSGYAPMFAGGCYLYLIRSRGWTFWRGAGLLASTVLSVIQIVRVQAGFTLLETVSAATIAGALMALCFTVGLAISLRWWQLRPSPTWYWLGSLTYPLYLLHCEIGFRLFGVLPGSDWVRVGISIVLCMAAAFLIVLTVERHICSYLNRLMLDAAAKLPVRSQS